MIRWWNEGRYERECAAFDVEHPLSREVWESLQRHQREEFHRFLLEYQPAHFFTIERPKDETEEWFRIRYQSYIDVRYTGLNGVFDIA